MWQTLSKGILRRVCLGRLTKLKIGSLRLGQAALGPGGAQLIKNHKLSKPWQEDYLPP